MIINPFSDPVYLLSPLVAVLVNALLIALVLTRTRRRFSDRIFCLFLAGMGLTSLFIFAMRASPDLQRALFWERAIIPAAAASFVFYYHFTAVYSGARNTILIRIAYLYLLIAIVLAPTNLLLQEMRVEYYGYAPTIGPLTAPMFAVMLLLLAGGVYNLFARYRRSSVYTERNRLIYFMMAALFPTIGAMLDALSNLPPVAIWSYLLFSLSCTVAMLKYHLLDINVVIRKGTGYFLMSSALAGVYMVVFVLSGNVFKLQTIPLWVYFIIMVILAFALHPAWLQLQHQIDRWFYRDRYDFLSALEDFSQQSHKIGDLKKLATSLVELTSQALRASSASLLLDSGKGDFTTVASTISDNPPLSLRSTSPLLLSLRSAGKALSRQDMTISPRLQSLTSKEVKILDTMRARLFVPIMNQERELFGLLIIGERLSQHPFSSEDERIVSVVANRISIELENARLYASERALRKELQAQDELKTEFLDSMAHELKTPLTAIMSSSELLSEEPSAATGLRGRLLGNIRRSTQSMDRRVDELLDLAKTRLGELDIEPEPLEIRNLIDDVVSQLHPLFENKEQTLRLEISDSLPKVNADRGRLEQVFFNLLSNANKFSAAGSEIILRARETNTEIVIEVEDSAPAITEEEKRRLFDPYYRGENADKRRRFPGLGLGLHISKKLVELHRGEIWVRSKPPKGNIFAFSLPALEPAEKKQDSPWLSPGVE